MMSGKSDNRLIEMIAAVAGSVTPGTPFFGGATSLSHGRARERVARTRGLFADRGLVAGDRVVIASAEDAAVATLYGAALTSGLTSVVLDPSASAAEFTVLIKRVEPAAIFIDTAVYERSLAVTREAAAPVICIEPERPVRNAFGLLRRAKRGNRTSDTYPTLLEQIAEDAPVAQPAPDDTALILFTSGTTSEPKGVELTFRNLGAQMDTFRRHYGIGVGAVLVNHLPLHHSDGLNQGPLLALANGATIVRPGPVSLHTLGNLLDIVYKCRATHLVTVPTVLAMMARLPADYDDSFSHPEFRFIGSTAGPLDEGVWHKVETRFGVMVVNAYGLTETCCEGLYCGPTPETRKVGTIGKPVDCEAMIADADGAPVAEGETGELWLRGDNIMRGYFEAPEATRAVLREDGWLKTGDLAARDEEGFYRIVGRIKSVIVRGGINIYPEDVTAVLLSAPGVAAAATVGLPDPMLGERVIGCVVPTAAAEPDLTLRAMECCQAELAREKLPDRIEVLEALPYGPSGKVEIAALRQILAGREQQAGASGGTLADKVIAIAADTFMRAPDTLLPETRLDDSNKVDSLRYLEFVMALERAFRIRLSPREIMTMSRLADAVEIVGRYLDDFERPLKIRA